MTPTCLKEADTLRVLHFPSHRFPFSLFSKKMASRVFATALRAASRRAIVPAVARPVAAMASANLKQTAVKASVSIV